jgi:hypothetical protein
MDAPPSEALIFRLRVGHAPGVLTSENPGYLRFK